VNKPKRLSPACLARAIAVNDATLRQIIWRKFEVDAVAGKNFDAMPAQTSSDVREDDMAIIQLYGKRRARKDLFDASEHLQRRLAVVLHGFGFGKARAQITFARCDSGAPFCALVFKAL
jgi:hypothetical protein